MSRHDSALALDDEVEATRGYLPDKHVGTVRLPGRKARPCVHDQVIGETYLRQAFGPMDCGSRPGASCDRGLRGDRREDLRGTNSNRTTDKTPDTTPRRRLQITLSRFIPGRQPIRDRTTHRTPNHSSTNHHRRTHPERRRRARHQPDNRRRDGNTRHNPDTDRRSVLPRPRIP